MLNNKILIISAIFMAILNTGQAQNKERPDETHSLPHDTETTSLDEEGVSTASDSSSASSLTNSSSESIDLSTLSQLISSEIQKSLASQQESIESFYDATMKKIKMKIQEPNHCEKNTRDSSCLEMMGCQWHSVPGHQNSGICLGLQDRCYHYSQDDCRSRLAKSQGCQWRNSSGRAPGRCVPQRCYAKYQHAGGFIGGCVNKAGCVNYLSERNPFCNPTLERHCGPVSCSHLEMIECNKEKVCQWMDNICIPRVNYVPATVQEAWKHSGKALLKHVKGFVGGVIVSIVSSLII